MFFPPSHLELFWSLGIPFLHGTLRVWLLWSFICSHYFVLFLRICWEIGATTWILCPPPSSYIEALTSYVTVLGTRPLRRWLQLKDVIRMESQPFMRGGRSMRGLSHSAVWEQSKKTIVCQPGKDPWLETRSADTLSLDFLASRTEGKYISVVKLLSLCYFIMAVWADWHNGS